MHQSASEIDMRLLALFNLRFGKTCSFEEDDPIGPFSQLQHESKSEASNISAGTVYPTDFKDEKERMPRKKGNHLNILSRNKKVRVKKPIAIELTDFSNPY